MILCSIHFYNRSELKRFRVHRSHPKHYLTHMILTPGYWHCAVEAGGLIYHCADRGPEVYEIEDYPFVPSNTVEIDIHRPLDTKWWRDGVQRDFDVVKSVLHVIGLPINPCHLVNCVQASIRLLRLDIRCRTPLGLKKALLAKGYKTNE